MHTRSLSTFCASAALVTCAFAQMPRIVVQGDGPPQVFASIDDAVVAAQPDDKLYLSGGTFTSDSSITVDKPLHFIGAGIRPDTSAVTGTTTISTPNNRYFVITTAGSGSTFTGIRFGLPEAMYFGWDGSNDDPTGLVFERCVFDNVLTVHNGSGSGSSSSVYDECVFHSHLYGLFGTQATLTRCVFDYAPGTGATISGFQGGGLTMRHCTALSSTVGNSGGATIENCVFSNTSFIIWQSNGAVLTNNLSAANGIWSNMTPASAVGNVEGVDPASIFINETNNDFEWSDDLRLQPSSPGVGLATDGTDVGVYGTNAPWKEGSAPYNPHFRSAAIAPATNPDGTLPVNIRVAAQTH